MSGSLNRVIIIGNLGKDPEIRKTQDGRAIANLSIATSESWKDKHTGEKREKVEWHRVVVFNENLSTVCEKYLRKGSKVCIEGKLQSRKWTDKEGVERYVTEIVMQAFDSKLVMLSSPPTKVASASQDDDGFANAPDEARAPVNGPAARRNDMDDEIPFSPERRG